jgi:predicted methyltransferase
VTKIRGGQQLIDQLLADLADIDDTADIDLRLVKFDPQGAHERLVEIRSLVHRMRRRISEDLDQALQRVEGRAAQATLPERVAVLEREVAELKSPGRGHETTD